MKAIITKFHGPTDTRGSRYSASDGDGNRVTVSTDFRLSADGNHAAAALALCAKMGWGGDLIQGWVRAGEYVHVFAHDTQIHNPIPIPLERTTA